MPVSPYPTETLGGPRANKVITHDPEWPHSRQETDDGGSDAETHGDVPILRWTRTYEGLSEVEAAILDAHYEEAKGTVGTFDYTDRDSGITYAGVSYAGRRRDHRKTYALFREDELIRRP